MERYAILSVGQTYRNRNGSDYICKQVGSDGTILERTTDRWTLEAHGINLYEDGTIEWDYSTGGHWPNGTPERLTASIRTACRGAFEDLIRADAR